MTPLPLQGKFSKVCGTNTVRDAEWLPRTEAKTQPITGSVRQSGLTPD